jgi:acyl-CoA dehydrogenase
MDFTLPPDLDAIRLRTRAFVAEHILPLESDPQSYDAHENIRMDALKAVQIKARAAGLW